MHQRLTLLGWMGGMSKESIYFRGCSTHVLRPPLAAWCNKASNVDCVGSTGVAVGAGA